MTKLFATADWHLGHANCLKFDDRPFADLDTMHKALIRRYNATVPWDGVCYFLGDMGFNGSLVNSIISQLNGKKILIVGNHDPKTIACYNCGFDAVVYKAALVIQNNLVTMSHCPLMGVFREDTSQMKNSGGNWHGELREKSHWFSCKDEGQFHLHGHCHSKPENKILNKQFDVGVVGSGFSPVSFSVIESWIVKHNKELK